MKKILFYTIVFIAFLTSCSFLKNQGSVETRDADRPVSIVSPIANATKIFFSAPSPEGQVRVTGIDGAVESESTVILKNRTSGPEIETRATRDGAFQAEITSQPGDLVELQVTKDGAADRLSHTASKEDPTPLNVNQTDVSVFQTEGRAFVSVSGNQGISLVEINLSERQVVQTHLLRDPESSAPLEDITMIEIFDRSRLAVIIERTQAKFYLVDLDSLTTKENPIDVTGRFANILALNDVRFKLNINIEESEALIRQAITTALVAFNDLITNLPDAGTSLFLDCQISASTSQLIIAGTFSGNGRILNVTIQNSDQTLTSEASLTLQGAVLSGVAVYGGRTRALLGVQNSQAGLGIQRPIYVVNLETMEQIDSRTILVDGIPKELVATLNEQSVYGTLSNIHQVIQIDTASLETTEHYPTGPFPSRLSVGLEGDLISALNDSDITVSLIETIP